MILFCINKTKQKRVCEYDQDSFHHVFDCCTSSFLVASRNNRVCIGINSFFGFIPKHLKNKFSNYWVIQKEEEEEKPIKMHVMHECEWYE